MDILVVGGTEFIGVNLIQCLLEKFPDYNIVCIDRLKKNIEEFENNKHFYFYQHNEIDLLKLFKFWYGFDIIINLIKDKDNDSKIVFDLLSIIKKYKVKKYLQVSLKSQDFTSLDILALSSFSSYKIPVVIAKYLNSYGFFQDNSELIPKLITNALEGKKILVPDHSSDLINVFDCCRGIETLMHYGEPGIVYEFGGGEKIKIVDVALFVMEYLSIPYEMLEKICSNESSRVLGFLKLNEQF